MRRRRRRRGRRRATRTTSAACPAAGRAAAQAGRGARGRDHRRAAQRALRACAGAKDAQPEDDPARSTRRSDGRDALARRAAGADARLAVVLRALADGGASRGVTMPSALACLRSASMRSCCRSRRVASLAVSCARGDAVVDALLLVAPRAGRCAACGAPGDCSGLRPRADSERHGTVADIDRERSVHGGLLRVVVEVSGGRSRVPPVNNAPPRTATTGARIAR